MKHVLCIQDLSCFGKCSLSVALPVLSVAGIQTSVLPTALLSTHTGGLGQPYKRDLQKDMDAIRRHWALLNLSIDAIYSGYVSNLAQLHEILHVFDQYPQALKIVDPVMGDHGALYASLPAQLCTEMRLLCQSADLITPNMTEAYALIEEPWQDGPYTKAEIVRVLHELAKITSAQIVLTGVYVTEAAIGCACFTSIKEEVSYCMRARIPQDYHGTGDLFAASLLGALMNEHPLAKAMEIAVNYTANCIQKSKDEAVDERYGVLFEPCLYEYGRNCQIKEK